MSKQLKIILGDKGDRLDADTVVASLENTLELLRNLEGNFPKHDDTIHWDIVSAKMSSPLTIAIEPRTTGLKATRLAQKIATAFVDGMRVLELRATIPEYFNEEAIEAAKQVATIVRDKRQKLQFTISNGRETTPVAPTEQTITHIKQIEEKARLFVDYATFEGTLEEVSVHGTHHVNLWETLTNLKIECRVPVDLLEQAKTVLGRRVALTGRVRYRNNRPRMMQVESMRVMRDIKDLPQPDTMRPIDITEGEDSEDFVRRLRDAE